MTTSITANHPLTQRGRFRAALRRRTVPSSSNHGEITPPNLLSSPALRTVRCDDKHHSKPSLFQRGRFRAAHRRRTVPSSSNHGKTTPPNPPSSPALRTVRCDGKHHSKPSLFPTGTVSRGAPTPHGTVLKQSRDNHPTKTTFLTRLEDGSL